MIEKECFETLCNTGDGVFIVDADRHIVRWNKAAERILKYSENEVLNRDCFRVISGRSFPNKSFCRRKCRIHGSVLTGKPAKNFELLTQTGDGKPLWLNVTVLSPRDTSEPFIAHIVRDVTREKNASLALERFLDNLAPSHRMTRHPMTRHPMTHHPMTRKKAGDEPAGELLPVSGHGAPDKPAVALSARETEVMALLAEGLSTKSLAQKLKISRFTARNHIQNILVKLGLHSKAQAVSYAFKKGIL